MFFPNKIKLSAASIAVALVSTCFSSFAALERTGPVSADPAVGKFPAWYQDKKGITLEFCAPNAAELADGSCLVTAPAAPGAPGVLSVPESLPDNFFDEHFYYAAGATLAPNGTGKAILTLAEEAAFASGAAVDGQQIVFSRIRVLLNPIPTTGSYTFIHPYGRITLDGQAGGKIFFTDDVGATCTGDFTCSLKSELGPFLIPSNTAGGAELPPFAANGKLYLADPARIGPVTGGLPGQNKFRIEGPVGSNLGGPGVDFIETTDFTLMGRLFTGVLPGRVTVDRASYTNNGATTNLDVFATAVPTTASRLPGSAAAPAGGIEPALSFYDRTCGGVVNPLDPTGPLLPPYTAPVGGVLTAMRAASELRWGQTHPAAIPAEVCVVDSNARDANGNVISVYSPAAVKDEVTVTQALFNPDARSLAVQASSSDSVTPTLTLRLHYGAPIPRDLSGGTVTVADLLVPPPGVEVQSTQGGITKYEVTTGYASAAPTDFPVALNDSFPLSPDLFLMNGGSHVLDVLANDSAAPAGSTVTVNLTSQPAKGSAALNANGTVTYTPNANTSGADAFTYTITTSAGGLNFTSNAAVVAINIMEVDVAPVAANDSFNAIANTATSLNVLGNDTDVNGAANINVPVNVTLAQGSPVPTTLAVCGKLICFQGPAGTYTFTYQASDLAINGTGPLTSNPATVTVAVAAAESLAFTRVEYVRSKGRLRAEGTLTPAAGQQVRLDFVDPTTGQAVQLAGTTTVAGTGLWVLDTAVALPTLPGGGNPTLRATTSNGTVAASAITFK